MEQKDLDITNAPKPKEDSKLHIQSSHRSDGNDQVTKPRSTKPLTPKKGGDAKPCYRRPKRREDIPVMDIPGVKDDYAKASECANNVRKKTGLFQNEFMLKHKCEWDDNYPEYPGRMVAIMKRIEELRLVKELDINKYLVELDYELIENHEYYLTKHSAILLEKLESYADKNLKELEDESSNYDAIYINKDTYKAALIAASCVRELVVQVCKQEVITNGLAIVRPPGHHGMFEEFCGYCYFNNVALAAEHALNEKLAKKILIVDFDVHHGQATQDMFYDDDRVLYFSIHRYEYGSFWPNLRRSNFDYIGEGRGKGYNVNFPLNTIGLDDNDYLSIIFNILLPVAYEFNPDLIIVSAGYDAALGDDKGRMNVSPTFYGQLIKLLSGLAEGKIAVCLEGGYFLPSLSEGVARTLLSLLDFPCDKVMPLKTPNEVIVDVINSLRFYLQPYWNCFKETVSRKDDLQGIKILHNVNLTYEGKPDLPPYPTRDCYPKNSPLEIEKFTKIIADFKIENPVLPKRGVCYSYDESMLLHTSSNHPETPYRLQFLMEKFFEEFKFDKRCTKVDDIPATIDLLTKVHTEKYIRDLLAGEFTFDKTRTDIYINEHTKNASLKSVNCLLGVAEAVFSNQFDCGVALIRPPGHHAEKEEAGGFCFINNVAVAAAYLANKYSAKVLILDWDIHHGNGTQHMFYDNSQVMYISIHKFENGKFFPNSLDGDYDRVGEGSGVGYNVNIPFNKDRMRNEEYISIFHRIILPLAYSFAPDVVLVSAGFDAGVNDRLGNYKLTPEIFGHFVQLLRGLSQGKVILALEGGYNPTTVAYSMLMSIKALLGDPLPKLDDFKSILPGAEQTILQVVETQKQYWKALDVYRVLPAQP